MSNKRIILPVIDTYAKHPSPAGAKVPVEAAEAERANAEGDERGAGLDPAVRLVWCSQAESNVDGIAYMCRCQSAFPFDAALYDGLYEQTCLHRYERSPGGYSCAVKKASDDVAHKKNYISPVTMDINHQFLAPVLRHRLPWPEQRLLFIRRSRRCSPPACGRFGRIYGAISV